MLERGEIDVAGSGLFVTFDRTKVRFSKEFLYLCNQILTKDLVK